MKKLLFLIIISSFTVSAQDYAKYVNPFIGTGGHGHTFPGATVPYGMVQLSPDTRIDGSWDGCSGYHYSDNVIYGFSHTHLNGTGVSDYGDIMLMPTMGEPNLDKEAYSSTFSHANENASAGYYAVKLVDDDIQAELTTTPRVGLHQYTFSKKGQANIILDLNHRDHLLMGEVRIIDSKTIEVLRNSEAWARDQYVYARIEFSKPMTVTAVNNNAFAPAKTTDTFFAGSLLAISFSTDVKKNEKLLVKVALSPTGYGGAAKNMKAELPKWNFKKTKKAAEKLWNEELSKIEVTSSDKDKLAIFYTALYHTMMQPNIAMDVDGKYRGRDNEIHTAEGFDYYTVFSLWDTFRAAHPLYTLIDKKRTADYINTFITQYEQGGRLPVWELASNETDCMIGYHSVSVIADAMAKGVEGFDYKKAFEASKHSAMLNHLGLDAYKFQGYISIDNEHESVSKTLEYAYDDWCIAQMAMLLGEMDDYNYFMKRSQYWKNIFDPETNHMRPKKNGGWDKPFDPREVNNSFTEGNSWQYSFFVPQDIFGMIEAYGGNEAFEAKLDEMFNAPSQTTGREQVDVTGLIGQYAHGNEPSHHMAYLYNYVGKPEKTKEKVHYILNNFYKNSPDGLIGNEDCGQMSAWYVLSSMGIYDITPGKNGWDTVMPFFDKIAIHLADESQRILKPSTSRSLLGVIDTPNEQYTWEGHHYYEPIKPYDDIIPVPVIEAAGKSFKNQTTVTLKAPFGAEKMYYIINTPSNENESRDFQEYTAPFEVTETCEIRAYAEVGRTISLPVTANFVKKPNDYTIAIKSEYNPQYHAGGAEGLIDGIHGDGNWRKGDWQGYQGQDFEAVIDLQKKIPVTNIAARFLQDSRSWILMPTKVEFYTSDDNKNFTLIDTIENTIAPQDYAVQVTDFGTNPENVSARYIKVKAYNYGTLPEWHQGHGGEAFIFIDEITVE
ncbi:alpha-mannosidase [Flavobacterium salilacus subsp. salilacus]|uniref:GH92 family glycosyl hydrolase n=1 Tax=Flavobacterium TaxID=237 RepID=UPI0010752B4C|nr:MULTISPECIES: GH92 family glycosyl hydrolase [Flavobacterium]KAF2515109.1 alpha-mannosidase [Flavobacterium salilacus subsp. salilacus]MBE1615903.1 GH92 family glycosyl hydrolase [Flavobacterium sp. SaA2.13]